MRRVTDTHPDLATGVLARAEPAGRLAVFAPKRPFNLLTSNKAECHFSLLCGICR